ncbi:MAG: hypothetical protein IPJ07_23220 [Acidobacteria bacterium]|nr:hypothetical protein [Acidobacteriota bacterium]
MLETGIYGELTAESSPSTHSSDIHSGQTVATDRQRPARSFSKMEARMMKILRESIDP